MWGKDLAAMEVWMGNRHYKTHRGPMNIVRTESDNVECIELLKQIRTKARAAVAARAPARPTACDPNRDRQGASIDAPAPGGAPSTDSVHPSSFSLQPSASPQRIRDRYPHPGFDQACDRLMGRLPAKECQDHDTLFG